MERKEQLVGALRKIFWAYIFLYFDINIASIDILPAWVAYLFFYQAIQNGLILEEESTRLLKPICIILVIARFLDWIVVMFSIEMNILIISEFFAVIQLYFHFQLLTNLANIAHKYDCPQESSLLTFRTIHTVLLTVLAFTIQFPKIEGLSFIILLVQVIILVCICVVINQFRKAVEELPESTFFMQNIEI